MKNFKSILDYLKFESHVKNIGRYIYNQSVIDFLEAIHSTSESRKLIVPVGSAFWRSQLGSTYREPVGGNVVYEDNRPIPYPAERMKPLTNMASEGRANPKGIPYLYLSTDRETAMAECRPWLQTHISLGKFHTTCELLLVDCSKDEYGVLKFSDYAEKKYEPAYVEKVIWTHINRSFTQPIVPSDHTADYVPTQVLAEFFKSVDFRTKLTKGF